MSVYKTEKAIYTVSDFRLWADNGILELSPKFQRNPVWKPAARSFLIDTILRDMTIPTIYIRITQNKNMTGTLREIVDGQQRIRAVLDYIADSFKLSKSIKNDWSGLRFSGLSPEKQNQILNYSFATEIFKGISDAQIFEVFCRLNMNGVALNDQEIRNAQFFGQFKQLSYSLAFEFLEFWRDSGVFTDTGLARMLEVQLTSELLIAGLAGMQDKKKSINHFYEKFDQRYSSESRDERRFQNVMSTIVGTIGADLSNTEFARQPLFYSLYCATYHRMYGLPGVRRISPKTALKASDRAGLKKAILKLSGIVANARDPAYSAQSKYVKFLVACARQTDNIGPRTERFNVLYDEAF